MHLPTKLPRQLSWLGQILHTNQHKASHPDEQVNSNLVYRRRLRQSNQHTKHQTSIVHGKSLQEKGKATQHNNTTERQNNSPETIIFQKQIWITWAHDLFKLVVQNHLTTITITQPIKE